MGVAVGKGVGEDVGAGVIVLVGEGPKVGVEGIGVTSPKEQACNKKLKINN